MFKIKIPEITIDQCNHDPGAEESESGAGVVAQGQRNAIDPDRGVEGEREGKQLEENAKGHPSPPLQEPSQRKRDEEGRDKNHDCGNGAWWFSEGEHVR